MARYWVNVPGEGKPIDLSLEELVARQRAGNLPAGTLAVQQGSEAWAPVDAIDDVKAAIKALDEARPSNAPPSSAAQGVDLLEAPPSLGVSPALLGGAPPQEPPKEGAPGFAPPPIAPPPAPSKKSGRAFYALLVVAAAVLLGSGSLLCVWYKYGYTHAAVFDYVPSDCATLEYVDFAGIDDSPALAGLAAKRDRALADWDDDLDDEEGVKHAIDDDAHGRGATLYALRKIGLHPYGDVREIAYCEMHDEGELPTSLLVVGGIFRGKDVLAAIRSGILHRDKKYTEDDLKIEEVDGRTWLRVDEDRWATTATSQVVIVGPRKLIEKHLVARPVARAYGLKDELMLHHVVADAAKGGGPTEERWSFVKGKLVYVREAPAGSTLPDAAKTTLDGYKQLAERMRNLDGLDAIADGWANADVKQEGETMRTTITWTGSEATAAMKALIDADLREMKPLAESLKGVVGADFFHDAIVPGVDAFGLRLAPW